MNKTNKYTYSIILNMTILIFFVCFGKLNYEIEDNLVYSVYIANGEYHIIFLNYFFCAAVGVIQKLIYPLNAFSLSLVFLGFCSFVLITRIMLDKFNTVVATCITLFLNGFFAVNHYQTVSFTLAPAILCAAGYLGIIHFSRQRKNTLGIGIGSLLVFFGSLIRFKIFVASTAVALFFAIGFAVSECSRAEYKNERRKKFIASLLEKKRMIVVISVVLVCFIINYVSVYINTSTEELAYYAEYTAARSAVWDYAIPDYDECPDDYDAIGIDENDILMLRKGYMDDEGAFPLEKLYAISDIQEKYNKDHSESLFSTIKTMIASEFGNMRGIGDKGIACFAVALIVILFLVIMRARNYFVPFFLLIIAFILYLYLWRTGKVPFRAVYEIWICSAVFLLYSFSVTELKDVVRRVYCSKRRICLCAVVFMSIIVSCAGIYLSRLANDHIVSYGSIDTTAELRKYLEIHKDKKFEFSRSTGLSSKVNNVYFVSKSDYSQNWQSFNCTYYRHPDYTKSVVAFGTDNMYSNLLQDSVYFVDNDKTPVIDNMRSYLEKYYSNGNKVTYSLVSTISGYSIYKFQDSMD